MLDGFHRHHSQLVFRDRSRLCLSAAAFSVARRAAAKSLDPPDRAFLRGNGSLEQHRLFYEFHLAQVADDLTRNLPFQVDRTLVEVVLLHAFQHIEEASESRDTPSVSRSIAVLGWMIQERLQYILLQIGDRSLVELTQFGRSFGINRGAWESRLVGATAQAKAMMQISHARSLRLYPSTLVDDVMLGIDFFVETLNGDGACVSVKTDVDGRTRFLLEPTPGYEQAWNRIERGSRDFREYAHRDWRPLLLLMGKVRGEDFTLKQKPRRFARWVTTLEHVLNGTSTNPLYLTG